LRGSISVHNHVVSTRENMGDSFSLDDLLFAVKNRTSKQYLVSGERRDVFEFIESRTENELEKAWNDARHIVWEKSLLGKIRYDFWEQEEIVKILKNIFGGFNYGRF